MFIKHMYEDAHIAVFGKVVLEAVWQPLVTEKRKTGMSEHHGVLFDS
jgi:hypothetical protein